MSAFTYDDWNILAIKYQNMFGLAYATDTYNWDYGFSSLITVEPWDILAANDINKMIGYATDWCPTSAATIDITRKTWSQETLDEIDAVFNGTRCGDSGASEHLPIVATGSFSILATDSESDPIFTGRTLVNSIQLDIIGINDLVFSGGGTVEAYYEASFTRGPAPNLAWTNIPLRISNIVGGHTQFSFNDTVQLKMYNVSGYTFTPKWRHRQA